jgi:hypothetical protein
VESGFAAKPSGERAGIPFDHEIQVGRLIAHQQIPNGAADKMDARVIVEPANQRPGGWQRPYARDQIGWRRGFHIGDLCAPLGARRRRWH